MILLRRFKMAIKHETSPKIFFFFWLNTYLFYNQRINHCHRNKMLPLFPWKFLQLLSLGPPHPQEESQTNLFVQHLIGYLDRRKPSTAGNHKSCWMINYSVLFQIELLTAWPNHQQRNPLATSYRTQLSLHDDDLQHCFVSLDKKLCLIFFFNGINDTAGLGENL